MLNYKTSKKYPDEFYITSGVSGGVNVFNWVSRPYNAVPYSYFLDSEGVVDELVQANSASSLRETYSEVLDRYLGSADDNWAISIWQ